MFVYGKSRTIFFPSNTFIYGISRDDSKKINIRTCQQMILGRLSLFVVVCCYLMLFVVCLCLFSHCLSFVVSLCSFFVVVCGLSLFVVC